MKKHILFALLFCLLAGVASGQKNPVKNYDAKLGIGIFPTFLKDDTKLNVLPITASIDYRLNKKFSLGIYGGYSKSTASKQDIFGDSNFIQWSNQFTAVGLRGTIHHQTAYENWEVYGGMTLGMAFSDISILDGTKETAEYLKLEDQSEFIYTAFLGTRFHLSDQLGVFAELGFLTSLANIGVSYRFN
ncbi:MAG: outer membrane beta-barrel protein [Saprospiraceae bacterium]|nr:outer membrane beta-barrel protein [Saprospiraceae bacterium]